MVTRIARIKGFNKMVLGRDLANILKDGHVYSAQEVAGSIILHDLGEHAIPDGFGGVSLMVILKDGSYCMTKGEYHDVANFNSNSASIGPK